MVSYNCKRITTVPSCQPKTTNSPSLKPLPFLYSSVLATMSSPFSVQSSLILGDSTLSILSTRSFLPGTTPPFIKRSMAPTNHKDDGFTEENYFYEAAIILIRDAITLIRDTSNDCTSCLLKEANTLRQFQSLTVTSVSQICVRIANLGSARLGSAPLRFGLPRSSKHSSSSTYQSGWVVWSYHCSTGLTLPQVEAASHKQALVRGVQQHQFEAYGKYNWTGKERDLHSNIDLRFEAYGKYNWTGKERDLHNIDLRFEAYGKYNSRREGFARLVQGMNPDAALKLPMKAHFEEGAMAVL
ncbi:hypothetical protein AMTR_s00002p00242170 [Amborella trichopoda]|uniref:Uncharacterized protein n=1 Tax=Amborella trichopoda TaxID=13333 RepID=W1P2R7_AMBTC|nr:hypothetical protein AMTR_s00002p00242170 [Amborella trichopoda]